MVCWVFQRCLAENDLGREGVADLARGCCLAGFVGNDPCNFPVEVMFRGAACSGQLMRCSVMVSDSANLGLMSTLNLVNPSSHDMGNTRGGLISVGDEHYVLENGGEEVLWEGKGVTVGSFACPPNRAILTTSRFGIAGAGALKIFIPGRKVPLGGACSRRVWCESAGKGAFSRGALGCFWI